MRMQKFVVENDCNLIDCLRDYGYAKNKVKTYVRLGYITVNGVLICKLPFEVKKGDEIKIEENTSYSFSLDIIFEDDYYLIVNKEAGLLTISTSNLNKDREDTLYKRVRYYLNSKKEYAFIVNRIDKETSGLVVFVKNEGLRDTLQSNWNHIVKKRGYIAIVCGKITKQGRIDNYLYEDKMTFSHSTTRGGKRAITNYRPICDNERYTMLDVWIETGRKNQIRVHMTEMNHPIVGDKKYYSKDNSLHRLALHHYEISFIDPISKKLLTFHSEVPHEFYRLFD
jgi:23S rRNA pseudouridine1911/1915/1917 synthase